MDSSVGEMFPNMAKQGSYGRCDKVEGMQKLICSSEQKMLFPNGAG